MTSPPTEEPRNPADDWDEEHFPWSYTEFGTLCACGSAVDSDENCLSAEAELIRLRAAYERVVAERDELADEINVLEDTIEGQGREIAEGEAELARLRSDLARAMTVVRVVASWYPAHKRGKDCHAEGLLCPQTRAIVTAYEQWKDKTAE